jgi:NADP-dependent 3-hydroxy acid dehydrogenase YdfG
VIDVVRSRGALDVLVVNSGVIPFGDARTLDPDAVDHLIDVNVRAPYHASVEAAKRMNAGGRIIIIASVNGDRMAFAGAAAYALSKSALQGTLPDAGDDSLPSKVKEPFVFYGVPTRAGDRGRTGDVQLGKLSRPLWGKGFSAAVAETG